MKFRSFTIIALLLITSTISYASKQIPYSVRFIVYHAQKLMQDKRYDEAIQLLERFKKRDKSYSKHHLIDFLLGNCFFIKGEYKKAVQYYESSVRKNPKFFYGWFNLAECLYELKKYKEAAFSFVKAYNVSSKKDPEYLYYAGISFLSAGMCKDAIKELKKIFNSSKTKKTEWEEAIAHAYISCNEFKEALPFVEELSEKENKNKRRWQRIRVQLYLSLDMENKALSYLERLVKENPTDPIWWKGLAHIYLKRNQYKDALCALIIKGFLSPISDQEKRIMAQLNLMIGLPKQALKLYLQLANREPDSKLYYYIAQCYLRMHRSRDAIVYLDKAIRLDPKNKQYVILKANLFYQLGEYKKAGMIFENMARKNIEPARSWLMAGYSYISAGETKKAYYALSQARRYPKQKKSAEKALIFLNRKG